MTREQPQAPGRDLTREVMLDGPVLGNGPAPHGSWELRALCDAPDDVAGGRLYFYVHFWERRGFRSGGGGCGGVGLANDQRPVVISMSRRVLQSSFCYVGQVVPAGVRVQLRLTDDTTTDAALLEGDLPVRIWIAFTDGSAIPTEIRAFDEREELGTLSIAEEWPEPRTNSCWGPFDD